MLEKWGRDRRSLVEIGTFEGGSAVILRRAMHPEALLTLIQPVCAGQHLGQRGSYRISRLVVNRCRRGRVRFVRDYSFNVAKGWNTPLDFVFIEGEQEGTANNGHFGRTCYPPAVFLQSVRRCGARPILERRQRLRIGLSTLSKVILWVLVRLNAQR
jgi:hypothetical protein